MITLSNEFSFEYVASSGTVTYDGTHLLWHPSQEVDLSPFVRCTPSLTLRPNGDQRDLAPRERVAISESVVVNAKQLINPGLAWFDEHVGPSIDRNVIPLVVSVYSDSLSELGTMGAMLRDRKIVAIELNARCPNAQGEGFGDVVMVAAAAKVLIDSSGHPLIIKLSPLQDLEHIATVLDGIPEAFSINAVPWNTVYPGHNSPLARFGNGSVSGKAAQHWTWGALARLVAVSSVPIIGPGVWNEKDVATIRALGAQAVSFGSVFLAKPDKPTEWAMRDQARLRRSE